MNALLFTVCSLADYPFAVLLGQSLRQHQPEVSFCIGLADRVERLPVGAPTPFPVVGVEGIGIPDFSHFAEKYTWLEFLHATRPFFARHFLNQQPEVESLFFLAPQSHVLAPLTDWMQSVEGASIALSPFLLRPPADSQWPAERYFLNRGVYQNDLWALRRSPEADRFLDWWSTRTHEKGWLNLCKGYGLDGLWLNLVPSFFEGVTLFDHAGYGIGYFNSFERQSTDWKLVNFTGFDWARLHWQKHLTDRPFEAAWKKLALDYRAGLAPLQPESYTHQLPAFGSPYQPDLVSLARRRKIRSVLDLVAWIDSFQPDFLFK